MEYTLWLLFDLEWTLIRSIENDRKAIRNFRQESQVRLWSPGRDLNSRPTAITFYTRPLLYQTEPPGLI